MQSQTHRTRSDSVLRNSPLNEVRWGETRRFPTLWLVVSGQRPSMVTQCPDSATYRKPSRGWKLKVLSTSEKSSVPCKFGPLSFPHLQEELASCITAELPQSCKMHSHDTSHRLVLDSARRPQCLVLSSREKQKLLGQILICHGPANPKSLC